MTTWLGAGRADGHRGTLTIVAALGLFVLVTVLLWVADAPAVGVGFLYMLPIGLVAVERGWRWGVGAAVLCFAAYVLWAALDDVELSLVGYVTRAFVLVLLGGTLGWVAARARAAGDESERWFSMANVMLATSVDGRFSRLNPAWEATLGLTRAKLMSQPYVEFIHPDDVEATLAAVAAVTEGSSHMVDFENRFSTKDGGWLWLSWSSYSDGRRVYSMAQDVTGRKVLETERQDLFERLEAMARTDVLTGLPNRRAWDEELRREMARAQRQGHMLAVVMIDLDHFKDFNDANGHQGGDRLLGEIGNRWRTHLRVSDFVARYGGEEFAALLPACPPDEAVATVERLRVVIPEGQTCSAGIAYWDGQEGMEVLIRRADTALYEAKRAGRDRVVTAS